MRRDEGSLKRKGVRRIRGLVAIVVDVKDEMGKR